MNTVDTVLLDMTPEEAWRTREDRRKRDANVSSYAIVGSNANIDDCYAAIRGAELEVTGGDYENGTAQLNDELLVVYGRPHVLLTAEHATRHKRALSDGVIVKKDEDYGTGGLALLVARELSQQAIIARGRQTGDASHDEWHPLKDQMSKLITPESSAHFAIHQMMRGHAARPGDETSFHVLLGVGNNPSEATKTLVNDYLLGLATDMGLRAGVNQPHLLWDAKAKVPLLDDEGRIKTAVFAAAGPNTTRSFSQQRACVLGIDDAFASVQIEMSGALGYKADGDEIFNNESERRLGAYIGYAFVKLAVESALAL